MAKKNRELQKKKIWLVVLTLLILLLPWLLTREQISIMSFKETGPIGDTIGGILSPFIAILVGYLTFEAFRMQYEANELHREDKVNEKLAKERERFDNRFYTMLDTLRTNSLGVRLSNDITGKDAFRVLIAEFFVSYFVVKQAYLKYKPNAPEDVDAFLSTFRGNEEDRMLTRIAYGLFFYGNLYDVDREKEPLLYKVLDNIKQNAIRNGTGAKKAYDSYLNHDIKSGTLATLPWNLFQGYNAQLGHYFRHLYQMVKFLALADSKVISEDDKNEYARIIRSELSDFEQALLFYNAVSDRGQSWNSVAGAEEGNEYTKRGLISRFRLIKNIPGNILYRGVDPWTFYSGEEMWWKERGKSFFEQCYILTAEDEY